MDSKKVKSPTIVGIVDGGHKPEAEAKQIKVVDGGHKPSVKGSFIKIPANVES